MQAHRGPEIAALLVEVLEGVDAAQQAVFHQGVAGLLLDVAHEEVAAQARRPADLHRVDPGVAQEHHDRDRAGLVDASAHLDLVEETGGVEVGKGAAHGFLAEEVAGAEGEEALEVDRAPEGLVEPDLDGVEARCGSVSQGGRSRQAKEADGEGAGVPPRSGGAGSKGFRSGLADRGRGHVFRVLQTVCRVRAEGKVGAHSSLPARVFAGRREAPADKPPVLPTLSVSRVKPDPRRVAGKRAGSPTTRPAPAP